MDLQDTETSYTPVQFQRWKWFQAKCTPIFPAGAPEVYL